MDISVMSSPLFLFLTPFFLLFILKQIKSSFFKAHKLPPGPPPLPIIGNIHQVGKKPHVSMAKFSQEYGPLISLKLGTQVLVVASSPTAAAEILKTHDRELSSRHVPRAFHHENLPLSLIWALDCDTHWKSLRALCKTEMFSLKALESQSNMREKQLIQMLELLRSKEGKVVKIGEVVFATIFNTLSNILFSKDFVDLKDEQGTAYGLKEKLFEILEMSIAPNIGDYYPILDKFDLQGLRKTNTKLMKEVFGKWEIIINQRKDGNDLIGSRGSRDLLDTMLSLGFSNDQINLLAIELFTAGTDTTTSTIEWGMAELFKNKEAMSKVKEELRKETNSSASLIKESQASQLPYLNACIKETLRLHPPAPFLLPHRAHETCEVMNYTVPQNSQILVNIWAIGRDPSIWEDPFSFKPERFLDSNLDYKGQHFEYLPFGAGRRMCPGLPSATKQVAFILAALINNFDWLLPGNEDPQQLDMNDKFGVTLQKEKPLQLVLKQK